MTQIRLLTCMKPSMHPAHQPPHQPSMTRSPIITPIDCDVRHLSISVRWIVIVARLFLVRLSLAVLAMGFTTEQQSTFEKLYLDAAAAKDDMKIARLIDTMLELLVASGEAQVKHIAATRVVPHKANRSGSLLEVGKVYSKGSKIMGVGFSLARCDHKRAVAFQVKPGDDRDVKTFTDYARDSPHLATFDSASVEACSVGCGHLNQFLAAVFTECEVPPDFHGHNDLFGAQGVDFYVMLTTSCFSFSVCIV